MTPGGLSRPVRLETIGGAPRVVAITAEPAERAALADRFGLIELGRLDAEVRLDRDGDAIRAEGRLIADVVQACVATGEPVAAHIDEPFALRFVPETLIDQGDEVELSGLDCDTLPHDGKTIELGEAVAATLALALDPYPRAADADSVLRQAGVIDEDSARAAGSPFAGLKKR